MTKEQIIEALGGDAQLLTDVAAHVIGTDHGKQLVNNHADTVLEDRLTARTKETFDIFDNLVKDKLGAERQQKDGVFPKTSEFVGGFLDELVTLRGQKDTLDKDKVVIQLKQEITDLKANGGGKHWEDTYNTAKQQWLTEKEGFETKIDELTKGAYSSRVENDIANGYAKLKINPDIPKEAVEALYNSARTAMIANSKDNNGSIIYLKEDGTVIQNESLSPQSAEGVLAERMKSVILTADPNPGGGADEVIKGSIKTTKVEGKADEKSLVLTPGSFKTMVEFEKVAREALIAAGIPTSSDDFHTLKDKAYKDYEVDKLPRN